MIPIHMPTSSAPVRSALRAFTVLVFEYLESSASSSRILGAADRKNGCEARKGGRRARVVSLRDAGRSAGRPAECKARTAVLGTVKQPLAQPLAQLSAAWRQHVASRPSAALRKRESVSSRGLSYVHTHIRGPRQVAWPAPSSRPRPLARPCPTDGNERSSSSCATAGNCLRLPASRQPWPTCCL